MYEENKVLDYLYKEHKDMLDQVAKFEDRIDNIIVSSILIIGTITALVSNKDEGDLLKSIVIAIPIAAIVVLSVYCISYYKLMRCGGYKKYIEEKIVNIIGTKEVGWEKFVSDKNRRFDFLSISIYSVYIVVLLALSIFSLCNVYKIEKWIFYIEALFLLVIIGIFITILLRVGFRTYNETYLYFKNMSFNNEKNNEIYVKVDKEN